MQRLSLDDVRLLLASAPDPGVSLYVPNGRTGTQSSENRTQLRNQLRAAEGPLAAAGLDEEARTALLAPVLALVDDIGFWRQPPAGLAIFLGQSTVRVIEIDAPVDRQVFVGNRFHVKPLWPIVTDRLTFFVLALSQKAARLYRGDERGLEEVETEMLPMSLDATLRTDVAPSAQIRLRSAGSIGVGGRRGAVVHYGAASNEEPLRDEQLHFCQRVDAAVTTQIPAERPPLVLAGVRFLLDLYRQVSHYPGLVDAAIDGNVDRWDTTALHAAAWERLTPERGAQRLTALAEIDRLAHTGRVTTDLRKILPAARQGRVARLFVALDRAVWGSFDTETLAVHFNGEPPRPVLDDDLLDVAAGAAWTTGGDVHALPQSLMPGKALCAAVLRF